MSAIFKPVRMTLLSWGWQSLCVRVCQGVWCMSESEVFSRRNATPQHDKGLLIDGVGKNFCRLEDPNRITRTQITFLRSTWHNLCPERRGNWESGSYLQMWLDAWFISFLNLNWHFPGCQSPIIQKLPWGFGAQGLEKNDLGAQTLSSPSSGFLSFVTCLREFLLSLSLFSTLNFCLWLKPCLLKGDRGRLLRMEDTLWQPISSCSFLALQIHVCMHARKLLQLGGRQSGEMSIRGKQSLFLCWRWLITWGHQCNKADRKCKECFNEVFLD